VASLPLTPCQYASHELAQLPQVPQMPGGIPQVPTALHHSPTTTLHQATSGGVHQAAGSAAIAQMATTMATQVPTTMSGALQGHAVAISGHLGSLPAHAASMQLAQVSTMQPPAAHSAPTSLSHNAGEHRLVLAPCPPNPWQSRLIFPATTLRFLRICSCVRACEVSSRIVCLPGNADWSRTQLGWGQFNHFQSGEYGSSHTAGHQHGSHASQNIQSTANTASATSDWYDQGYDYTQHPQLNYHRSVGGIF